MATGGFAVRVMGDERLKRTFAQAPERMRRTLGDWLEQIIRSIARDAKLNAPVRSGRLRASIRGRVEPGRLRGVVGTDVIYARIQELGGVVQARRAKFLAIPLKAMLTPAGVARASPRDVPDTFVLRSRAGNLIIAQRKGRGSLTPLFVLKRQVRINRHPYLAPALERNLQQVKLLGPRIRAAIQAA